MIALIILLITIYLITNWNKTKNKFNKNQKVELPKNFYFGLATSSYQNEGGNYNNWTKWEEDHSLESVGNKVNMWNTFEEDVKNFEYLGINMFRFSIEWSRIQPKPNVIDYSALNKYLKWCQILKSKNIEPIVTLHHFTLPLWIDLNGSWENSENINHYLKYVSIVVKHLSKNVKYWITFNEPFLECLHGWILATRPPNVINKKPNNYEGFFKALRNICLAHGKAYHIIHKINPDTQVSIAKNLNLVKTYNQNSVIENLLIKYLDYLYNTSFLKALTEGEINFFFISKYLFGGIQENHEFLKNTLDFIGVNHYNQVYLKFDINSENKIDVKLNNPNNNFPINQMDWDVYPDGMYLVLKKLQKYNLPIIITENGNCDSNINSQIKHDYLISSLKGISQAIKEGIQVKGYNYWTYIDNFEWEFGYQPNFGLYNNNYQLTKTGKRYRDLILKNKKI